MQGYPAPDQIMQMLLVRVKSQGSRVKGEGRGSRVKGEGSCIKHQASGSRVKPKINITGKIPMEIIARIKKFSILWIFNLKVSIWSLYRLNFNLKGFKKYEPQS